MPHFSDRSVERLSSCHRDIQKLFNVVIVHFDCAVIQGFRGRDEQDRYFSEGRSKLEWPKSTHNKRPSMGIDIISYPIDWDDTNRHYYFGGFVLGIAAHLGIPLRWGGDWDSDKEIKDQKFNDLVHFELIVVTENFL